MSDTRSNKCYKINKNNQIHKSKKKERRIHKDVDKYDINECDRAIENILYSFAVKLNIKDERIKEKLNNITFKIYPYCSEKLHIHSTLNKVNAPKIDYTILEMIHKSLEYRYELFKEEEFKKNKKSIISPYVNMQYNVDRFINMMNKAFRENKNNYFIVSHSNFISKLYKKFCTVDNKIKLDNLDIIHFRYSGTSIEFHDIYRWNDSYKSYNRIVNNDTENDSENNTNNLLIMRHCAGCHNHPKTRKKDKLLKDSSGKHAICFQEIINQFSEGDFKKRIALNNLFERFGGIDNYEFGSSIIFRTILTVIIIYSLLINYQLEKEVNPSKEKIFFLKV